jgi:hypothetical protein
VIKVGMATVLAAPRARVWAALTDPVEVARWRPGLRGAPRGAPGYPAPGAAVRWRCRVRDLPLELEETPIEIALGERLHTRFRLGLFAFEATFALAPVEGESERTRVGLQIHVGNEVPVVGGTLDRFSVRRLATELAATNLQALRDWCEASRRRRRAPAPELYALAAAAR